jgi:hypothetical protein
MSNKKEVSKVCPTAKENNKGLAKLPKPLV